MEVSFYEKVKGMAQEMGLEGDDLDNFINQAMEKKGGHRKVTTWVPDDGKGDKDKGKGTSWF
jgi:hypothetical protein